MNDTANMRGWAMETPGQPLKLVTRPLPPPGPKQVRIRVVGSGVCHTDVSFLYGGVKTRMEPPLILGHEISGVVDAAGEGAEEWLGRAVVVPAVIPCGACDVCKRGRGNICPRQIFPGNDVDGGFASHTLVPAHALAEVKIDTPDHSGTIGKSGVELAEYAVIADAVSTAYQAVRRSEVGEGQLAIIIGAGGVGGFAVQIAHARGATVVAVDIDPHRLNQIADHGAELTLNARDGGKAIKKAIQGFAKEKGLPRTEWRIFETSGTAAGQELAFRLLVHGAYLGVVGFTMDTVTVRLSNLMALEAKAEGHWGCLPEYYPEVLQLVNDGKVALAPFVEKRPLKEVNEVLEAMHEGKLKSRVVLLPDAD